MGKLPTSYGLATGKQSGVMNLGPHKLARYTTDTVTAATSSAYKKLMSIAKTHSVTHTPNAKRCVRIIVSCRIRSQNNTVVQKHFSICYTNKN